MLSAVSAVSFSSRDGLKTAFSLSWSGDDETKDCSRHHRHVQRRITTSWKFNFCWRVTNSLRDEWVFMNTLTYELLKASMDPSKDLAIAMCKLPLGGVCFRF